ncbi:unnamed protein product [Hyaloperonospora brassicae]|uniref:Retrotransposon gag domain-containing protein n=2 Tax=Hyaloperonospora brassicae TaxID=162125 RepID=A0AAV0V326_HYABA|nr:unnamed protein product [Hyaloperonospora brassicae]
MNMLDEEETFHATRKGFTHLSEIEWGAVERMSSTVGELVASAMLESLDRDQQHAAIAKFIQNELAIEREKVALLHQQVSQQAEQLRELGAQQTELLRRQQFHAAVGGTAHARRPEVMKVDISKYSGVPEDSLLLWFVELDRALRARRVEDEQIKLTFAQTHLAGRAKTWSLGLESSDLNVFRSLDDFKFRLRQTFEPPRAEFRAR